MIGEGVVDKVLIDWFARDVDCFCFVLYCHGCVDKYQFVKYDHLWIDGMVALLWK